MTQRRYYDGCDTPLDTVSYWTVSRSSTLTVTLGEGTPDEDYCTDCWRVGRNAIRAERAS